MEGNYMIRNIVFDISNVLSKFCFLFPQGGRINDIRNK